MIQNLVITVDTRNLRNSRHMNVLIVQTNDASTKVLVRRTLSYHLSVLRTRHRIRRTHLRQSSVSQSINRLLWRRHHNAEGVSRLRRRNIQASLLVLPVSLIDSSSLQGPSSYHIIAFLFNHIITSIMFNV